MMQTATRAARAVYYRQAESQRTLALLVKHEQRHRRNNHLLPSSSQLHTFALTTRDDSKEQQERARLQSVPSAAAYYHTTTPSEKGVALVLGLGAVSAAAFAASSAVKSYNEWKESQPEAPPEQPEAEKQKEEKAQEQKKTKEGEKRENIFAKWFNVGVGSKFYEGGFEETMTRKEAALILGVRESSSAQRIKEAHRKLLVLNHPDTGGSTYMAGKINEAKELLLKGKKL